MTHISVLYLMNVVGDSSSGRIVQRLVAHLAQLGKQYYNWHVVGVRGLWGNLHEEYVRP